MTEHTKTASRRTRQNTLPFADTAHALQTPLTILRGHLQLLAIEYGRNTHLELCDCLITDLSKRIDTLIRSGAVSPKRRERFSLSTMVSELCAVFEPSARFKHARLRACVPEKPLFLVGNPERVEEMLAILIGNSIKYSKSRGARDISVRVWQEHTLAHIEVHDTGIGIPKRDIPRVFDRLYRGTNVGTKTGTGLGLSVVKAVAMEHGGDATIESRVGKFTTVRVSIPCPNE